MEMPVGSVGRFMLGFAFGSAPSYGVDCFETGGVDRFDAA